MQVTKKPLQTLMIQGTTSDAGKTTLVTAFCRYFYRQGIQVAPFKAQNMALNSAVTAEGGEIGRAQAVQAAACRLEPHVDMNPVLLKPDSDKHAQVIIHGKVVKNFSAKKYHNYKKQAMQAVLESYHRLTEQYQMIVVEGAGSPAEINLREGDIANMGFAEAVDCPVIIIADIDRGGVFAHIVGTLALLSESEQNRVIGFVINRFRGDIALLEPGLEWLERRVGKPVLAVLPYLQDLYLDAEDSIVQQKEEGKAVFNIVVPVFPRISNHTDFDPLLLQVEISLKFIKDPQQDMIADLIILPGSKAVRDDLQWLHASGWVDVIKKHLRYGGKVMGICGGFQMLGDKIHDPQGVEGISGSSPGLGFLDMETTLQSDKCLRNVAGFLYDSQVPVSGYEIHAGVTQGAALESPVMILNGENEGAFSTDRQVMGTYLHGLFDRPEASRELLHWAGFQVQEMLNLDDVREAGINLMTDTLEKYMDVVKFEKALDKFESEK